MELSTKQTERLITAFEKIGEGLCRIASSAELQSDVAERALKMANEQLKMAKEALID